jgi:transcriptional regulator with XRE-family HTH domain
MEATRFDRSRLRAARLEAGFSQAGLAAQAAMHVTTVGEYERGLKIPGFDAFVRLIEVLDLRPEALITDYEAPVGTSEPTMQSTRQDEDAS